MQTLCCGGEGCTCVIRFLDVLESWRCVSSLCSPACHVCPSCLLRQGPSTSSASCAGLARVSTRAAPCAENPLTWPRPPLRSLPQARMAGGDNRHRRRPRRSPRQMTPRQMTPQQMTPQHMRPQQQMTPQHMRPPPSPPPARVTSPPPQAQVRMRSRRVALRCPRESFTGGW